MYMIHQVLPLDITYEEWRKEEREDTPLQGEDEEAEELRRRGILCFSLISHLLYYMAIYYDSLLTEFVSL